MPIALKLRPVGGQVLAPDPEQEREQLGFVVVALLLMMTEGPYGQLEHHYRDKRFIYTARNVSLDFITERKSL